MEKRAHMEKTGYAAWFLVTVLATVAALAGFNAAAGAYIFHHPAGASVQTLSGFERALKPVWLTEYGKPRGLAGVTAAPTIATDHPAKLETGPAFRLEKADAPDHTASRSLFHRPWSKATQLPMAHDHGH